MSRRRRFSSRRSSSASASRRPSRSSSVRSYSGPYRARRRWLRRRPTTAHVMPASTIRTATTIKIHAQPGILHLLKAGVLFPSFEKQNLSFALRLAAGNGRPRSASWLVPSARKREKASWDKAFAEDRRRWRGAERSAVFLSRGYDGGARPPARRALLDFGAGE